MAGYITHGQEKSVVLSASQVDALVAGGSGDAALLYLLLQRLDGPVTAETLAARLNWSQLRLSAAETALQDMGFLRRSQQPPAPSEEHRVYSGAELADLLEADSGFRMLVSQTEEKLGKKLFVVVSPSGKKRVEGIIAKSAASECHVTVSGTGLRIFVCIVVVHPDVYRRAYEIVAHALEQVAGHPCDMQCKDLCRLTLASYDPEAYLAPEPLTFPYEEGNNPLLYQPATGTDSSEDYRFNGRNAGNASGPAPGNMPGYAPGNPADYASGNAGFRPFGIPEDPNDDCRYVPLRDPEAFLANFFRKNKFQEGQRHNVLLRLGRNIRWRRFNPYDFERLKHSAFRMMGQLPYSEYCSAMDWGYNHADLGPWVHIFSNGPIIR